VFVLEDLCVSVLEARKVGLLAVIGIRGAGLLTTASDFMLFFFLAMVIFSHIFQPLLVRGFVRAIRFTDLQVLYLYHNPESEIKSASLQTSPHAVPGNRRNSLRHSSTGTDFGHQ
jgi:hypothetical protein